MNLRLFYRVALVVLVIQGIVAVWGFAQVGFDAQVPIHWDAAGNANGFAPAWVGFLLTPAITAGLVLLFAYIPKLEPRRANLLRSSSAYVTVAIGMLVLMLGVHVATVGAGVGLNLPITVIIGAGVGLLFVLLGNVLSTVRSNFLFGVRTPWTLTSDLSWDRTHRLMGRLWVVGGVLMFLTSLVGPPQVLVAVILVFSLGTVAIGFVYSYQIWKTDPNRRSMGGDQA